MNIEYSAGKITSNQTLSREEIKCTILPKDGIKIKLLIYKSGVFQMSMSYCNANDIQSRLCEKLINKNNYPLKKDDFNLVRSIFIDIFEYKSDLYRKNQTIFNNSDKIWTNTISGNSPGYRPPPGKTEVCRISSQGVGTRPIPYSWKGKCPVSGQQLQFKGIFGEDGLYYPCCSQTNSNNTDIMTKFNGNKNDLDNGYLITGFPKNKEEEKEYSVDKNEDYKSGLLETTKIGDITKALIKNEYQKVEILSSSGKSVRNKEFNVKIIDTGEIIKIQRSQIKRESRYFPGLKHFSKEQLIKCILNKYKFIEDKTVYNENNLIELKNYIDLSNLIYNNIFSINKLNIFKTKSFFITSIPANCTQYYLLILNGNNYLINNFGDKKDIIISETIDYNIIFNGYFINDKYYIIDILYLDELLNTIQFNEKIEIINELEQEYSFSANNIFISEYQDDNYIKIASDLVNENKDINLIFMPIIQNDSMNYLEWNSNFIVDNNIILQVISNIKTNNYTIGYNDKVINCGINLNNIKINKKLNVKVGDYIQFKFDFNLETKELTKYVLIPIKIIDKPILNLNDTLAKISLIINPIKESFFINNIINGEYVWINSNENLKYNNDDQLLINYTE